MIRRRSLRKRTSSRCQTILIARSSLRQERRGTLTRMTSGDGAHRRPPPVITCIMMRLRTADESDSASRIVEPV
jgi:hypothetical protein